MELDVSAIAFDNILCQSGQFGFFQKRLFLIATLIQSACVSVLLYTCTCIPEVEELDEACASTSGRFVITDNGFGPHHEYSIPNSTTHFLNVTAAAAGISSIINSSILNTDTVSATSASSLDSVVHDLAASVLSTNTQHTMGRTSLAKFSNGHTTNTIPPNIKSTTSSSSQSPAQLVPPATIAPFSPTTISTSVPLPSPDQTNASAYDSDPASSITTTLEYLLQNIANVTADLELTLGEINSNNVNLHNTLRSFNRNRQSRMIPHENKEVTLAPAETLGGAKHLPQNTVHDANDELEDKEEHDSLVLDPLVINSTDSMDAIVSAFVNLTRTLFDKLNTSTFHLRGGSVSGHDDTLLSLIATESSINRTTESTVSPECRKAFILLRTELAKTKILAKLSLEDLVKATVYAQSAAMILGAGLGSMVADMYGRRRLLFTSLAAMLVLHCLVAASVSWLMFIVLRALAVGFAGATLVVSFVLVIEFLGPDWRDACTCSCLWVLGAVLMAMQTLVTVHWRWLALLSGGICLPLVGAFFTSTESVRWLQCQQRFTEAEYGLREVVSVNAATVTNIMQLLDHSRACIVNNMHYKRFTFLDLFHSLASTRWTLALIYTGTVTSCVYFCLLGRVRQITSLAYIDGFLPFIFDLPLTWSVIVVNRCLGRRWCLFLYAVASAFSLLCVLVLHITGNVANMPSLVTGLSLFGKIGVTASLSLVFLVAIEMYPTVTRCMGFAVAVSSGSAGLMLSNALDFLEKYHYTVPFVVYGAMMASVGAVGLFFPETLHRSLTNVQQCRHRKIPLQEGARLVGRPPNLWDDC